MRKRKEGIGCYFCTFLNGIVYAVGIIVMTTTIVRLPSMVYGSRECRRAAGASGAAVTAMLVWA